jgi:hypothetical protein
MLRFAGCNTSGVHGISPVPVSLDPAVSRRFPIGLDQREMLGHEVPGAAGLVGWAVPHLASGL